MELKNCEKSGGLQNQNNETLNIILNDFEIQLESRMLDKINIELGDLKQRLQKESKKTVESFLRGIMANYSLELKQQKGQNSGRYKLSNQVDRIGDIVIGNVISSKDLCEEIMNEFGVSERTARRCMAKAINEGKINCSSIGKHKYYFVDFADFETFRTEAVGI